MSYIGMVTNALGNIMDSIAATRENQEMQGAFNEEMGQQGRFGQQAYGQWLAGLPGQSAGAATTSINNGANNRMSQMNSLMATPLLANQGTGNGSPYGATDRAALNLQGAASAKVGGLSDWQINNAINNIRTNEALRRINFRSQGNAQVFPYKMYQAQHSSDELAFWGEVLKSIGGSGSPASTISGGSSSSVGPMGGSAMSSPYAGSDMGEGMDTSGIA